VTFCFILFLFTTLTSSYLKILENVDPKLCFALQNGSRKCNKHNVRFFNETSYFLSKFKFFY